eukprot:7105685-Prymnesium_polylepis.1
MAYMLLKKKKQSLDEVVDNFNFMELGGLDEREHSGDPGDYFDLLKRMGRREGKVSKGLMRSIELLDKQIVDNAANKRKAAPTPPGHHASAQPGSKSRERLDSGRAASSSGLENPTHQGKARPLGGDLYEDVNATGHKRPATSDNKQPLTPELMKVGVRSSDPLKWSPELTALTSRVPPITPLRRSQSGRSCKRIGIS